MLIINNILIVCLITIICLWIYHNEKKSGERFFNCQTKRLFKQTDMVYLQCNRMFGHYFQKPVLLLADTGANANFISESFIKSIYPQYKEHVLLGDDVMSVNGTMTSNEIVEVPLHIIPDYENTEQFTLLQNTESFDYLSKESGYNVVGIIGTDMLRKLSSCINFEKL